MTNKELEQLNIKIAKKLGWKRFHLERAPEPLNTRRMTGLAPGNIRNQYVPSFTNNLAYAMKLVDWAVEHGYTFYLTRYPSDEGRYEAKFFDGIEFAFKEFGTLPSVAICLAFLKIK